MSNASEDLPDPESPVNTISSVARQIERDIPEVVLARSTDDEAIGHRVENTGALGGDLLAIGARPVSGRAQVGTGAPSVSATIARRSSAISSRSRAASS